MCQRNLVVYGYLITWIIEFNILPAIGKRVPFGRREEPLELFE